MKRRPTTPGEMLLEEFLEPAGITQVALAAKMRVPDPARERDYLGAKPLIRPSQRAARGARPLRSRGQPRVGGLLTAHD